jgi:hypothetical protein
MKNLFRNAWMLFIICFLLIAVINCYDEQKNLKPHAQLLKKPEHNINDHTTPKVISFEITQEIPGAASPIAEVLPVAEMLPIAEILPVAEPETLVPPTIVGVDYPGVLTPLTAPLEFARSVFDDNIAIDPWLANYVGSYGVLPGRFGRAPFFYSFSRDADNFQDSDFAPLDDDFFNKSDDEE